MERSAIRANPTRFARVRPRPCWARADDSRHESDDKSRPDFAALDPGYRTRCGTCALQHARRLLLAVLACLTCLGPLAAQDPALLEAVPRSGTRVDPVAAQHGMVVAQEARAARIGVDILQRAATRSMPRSRPASRWR